MSARVADRFHAVVFITVATMVALGSGSTALAWQGHGGGHPGGPGMGGHPGGPGMRGHPGGPGMGGGMMMGGGMGGMMFFNVGMGGLSGPFTPTFAVGPGFFPMPWGPPMMGPPMGMGMGMGGPMMNRGPLLPPPPPGLLPAAVPIPKRVPARKSDPARSAQLTTIGDRMFRTGNLKRAEERYQQAITAAPELAAPRARLAQVALSRGRYAVAADQLRQAETAQPGWILKAPDIQALYREPGDYARDLAKLETHLQIEPEDRDAWLVLGAQWFLSGRTAKAADVFRRLDDPNRRSDVALEAFLEASNQAPALALPRQGR